MSKRWQLALGIPFFALMFFYLGVRAYAGLILPGTVGRRGWGAELRDGKNIVTAVADGMPASGVLQVGDEIVALRSARADRMPIVTQEFWRIPPGTAYTLVIQRAGETRELTLQTIVIQSNGPQGTFLIIFLITLALFLFTGLTVFVLKLGDQQAWLLALILSSVTALIPLNVIFATLPRWVGYTVSLIRVIATIFLPVFLHFFLIFPARSPLLQRFPRLLRLGYLSYWVILLPLFTLQLLIDSEYIQVWRNAVGDGIDLVFTALALTYLAAGLVSMMINYRAADAGARRKLRVVMAGSGAGFFNLFLMPLGDAINLQRSFPELWGWLDVGLLFTLPLIPLSFAYAIVKHRVIPVSLIIRRGVRYVLVARGSILLEAIVVTGCVTLALTYIFNRTRPPGIVIGLVSAGLGVGSYLLFRALHEKYLAPIIDRRFFRQSYDARQIITDLALSLRTTTDLPQLVAQVATKLQTALQTESVTVLLRDDATGNYLSHYSCYYDPAAGRALEGRDQFRLPHDASVVTQLTESRQPLEIDLSVAEAKRSAAEQTALEQMKTALLLPLVGKEGMPGIIALGARLGDLPYSGEDKDLLLSMAGPTTLAIENARLVERMIADARHRQELEAENALHARELEEARQLQLSMLPKTVPQLPQVEIAAYMKTATEVGGDYYDFHQAGNGELTIAVGDATGHGLKAGTVVAATKSLFNHLAPQLEVTEILRDASRALKGMNLRGLFMAMTMAKVAGHELRLSAAGMPPILLYHARTQTVEELLIVGVPLGSLSNYHYRSHALQLEAGDVVLLMSDGFPERFNAAGEMLGYAPAKEALRATAAASAQAIIEQLITVGEVWAAGHPQDDDVTFVVLKIKAEV